MFIEERFPTNISLGMRGGPEFSTMISQSFSGYEVRNINWLESRNKYEISKSITNENDLEQILSFFQICKGRGIGFRFKDHADFMAKNQLLFESDGKTLTFPIYKTYKLGILTYKRRIFKPVMGSIKLAMCEAKVKYSVDYVNGIIKLEKPLSQGCKVSGSYEFDVPVRFNNDHLELINHYRRIYSIDRLELIETKL